MPSQAPMFSGGQHNMSSSGAYFIDENANITVHQQFNITNNKGFKAAGFSKLQNNVVPAALHDSGETSDPPKCHPGTRVDVLTILMTWALAAIYAYPIRWLNGPSGAGKSAIMRSFAEMLVEKGLLLASFFFFKADGKRNTSEHLISTIAYQLCLNVPPLQPWVERAVLSNPLIFNASLAIQTKTLIIDPLLHYFYDPDSIIITPFPRIIIIDGLDECTCHEQQEEMLEVLCKMVQTLPIPIAIVFASRPEHQIRSAFELGRLSKASSRIVLDNSFKPDEDIRHFYVTEFEKIRADHPMRSCLGAVWPSQEDLHILIYNASGQFIYASTVVKFVGSHCYNPALRLQIILGQADRGPFQQLDNLYTVIFLNVDPEILPDTLRVLGIILTPPVDGKAEYQSPRFLELLLGFPSGIGHVQSLLFNLLSLLTVTDDGDGIYIYHISLSDFLFDKSRAGAFSIDRGLVYEDIAWLCIRRFCHPPATNLRLSYHPLRLYFGAQLHISLQKATPTDRLHHSIVSCNVNRLIGFQQPDGVEISQLAPPFLIGIKESQYPDAESLYQMTLVSFSKIVNPKLEKHWLQPTGPKLVRHWLCEHDSHDWNARPSLLFVVFLALTPQVSPVQAIHFVNYFFPGEHISILPGVTYRGIQGDDASSTAEYWVLLSRLILAMMISPTGLLHTQGGQEFWTLLTIEIVKEIPLNNRRISGSGCSEADLERSLDLVLPFLLNMSLVQDDLSLAIQSAQRAQARDGSKLIPGALTAAMDSYLQRIGPDPEPEDREVTEQMAKEQVATEQVAPGQEAMDWEVIKLEAMDQQATEQVAPEQEAMDWEVIEQEATE